MNKKLKKGLTVSSAAAMGMSIVLPTVSVIAAPAVTNGWVNQNGTWYYYNNGTLVKNGWAKDSKGWAFLSAVDGSWVQEGWAKDSTGWGYIRNGYWVEHATYAKDANGWEFIGANGYWDSSVAPSATNPIDDATAAVVKAEGSKLAADVDAAKALVAKLQDAIPEKAALTSRLNGVNVNFEVASVTVVDALHVKVVFTQAVDEDTAEDASNYSFDGKTDWVHEAVLQEDGKSVVLELEDAKALTNDSDDDYTVKITDVENKDGKVIDDYKEVLSLYDDVKPTVESVDMSDRDTLKITFSEDIKTVGDITVYDEDGDDIDVSSSNIKVDSDDHNVIKVTGLGGEDEGDYTVEIKNTKDYAGNKVETVTKDFTMEEDNSDPSVSSIKSISSTTLKITFDEAIDIDAGLSVEVTGKQGSFTLDESNATEVGGSDKKAYFVKVSNTSLDDGTSYKVVVDGYCDLAGNDGDSKTRYVKFDNEVGPELDSTEGVIKSYRGHKYAVFTFDQDVVNNDSDDSKDESYVTNVDLDGSFEDEDGDTIDVTIDKDDVLTSLDLSDLDDNQVAIRLSPYDKGDYTVTFDDGFIKTNDVESDSVDVTFSVTSEEEDDVTVNTVTYDPVNNYVYVMFTDEVDGESALDESNYEIDGDDIFENARFVSYKDKDYDVSSTDKQCVRLEVPDDTEAYTNKDFTIENIKDANDNDVEDYKETGFDINSTEGPKVADAVIIADNKVQVYFDKAIDNLSKIDEDDFEVTVNKEDVDIDSVSASSDGKVFTITLDEAIDAEDQGDVRAGTSEDFDGEDAKGNDGEVGKLVKADLGDAYVDSSAAATKALTDAKAKVPADLTVYTDATALAVTNALALPEVTDANKTAKATAINTAVANLVTKVADINSSLADAKAKVPADLSIYTAATAQAVTDALALPEVTDVNKTVKTAAINTAVSNLVTKVGDAVTTALNAAKASVPSAAVLATKTNVTVKAVTDALALPEVTDTNKIDKTAAINAAVAGLVAKADLTAYNAALALVDEADYTTASWATYQEVVAANVVTGENTTAQVATAVNNITTAQGKLVLLADLTAYNAALALVDEADYTAASWSIYQDVVAANVVTDQDTQAKVDAATAKITAAQAILVTNP